MSAHVTSTGFEADGVRLITPADAEFHALIEVLAAPGWAQTLREAAPSIVIVSNETDQKIVALSTNFNLTGGPRQGPNSVFYVAPDAIAPTDLDYGRASAKGIPPGRQQMIGFDFAVPDDRYYSGFTPAEADCYDPQVRDWIQTTAREIASARAVHVSFDAVIFEDGRLLGDPASTLAAHFNALVQAQQDLYRSVLDKLEAGEGADDVTRRLWPADEVDDLDQLTTEWHAMNEARNAVATLLEKYGGAALAGVLRRALIPHPFVIRKSTSV